MYIFYDAPVYNIAAQLKKKWFCLCFVFIEMIKKYSQNEARAPVDIWVGFAVGLFVGLLLGCPVGIAEA